MINSCNLRCQGCWVDVAEKQQKIDVASMDRLIKEAKAVGSKGARSSAIYAYKRVVKSHKGTVAARIAEERIAALAGK